MQEDHHLIELEGVSVSYRGKQVVHDIDLRVVASEVVALIGPSGAGKSSLLRTVNLLEEPSTGSIRVAEHVICAGGGRRNVPALTALRRDVGMVFQSFNLFPHLSARENIMVAQTQVLRRSKASSAERAVRELERVGLGEFADRKPDRLSGGQQQRVAIARALAMDPKVMLFDEPTSALDPERALEVLATMRQLAGEGTTMLVVTHEMHFAEEVADRVVFMAEGRIVEQGPARALLRNPRHERTQRFLAAVNR